MTPARQADQGPRAIPEASVARLAVYLRMLGELAEQGADDGVERGARRRRRRQLREAAQGPLLPRFATASAASATTSARCADQLERVLGLDHRQAVALIGVGNLGHALAGYGGFGGRGFPVTALFDVDPDLVGIPINGILVDHVRDIPAVCAERGITIGMIATPGQAAQAVCDRLVAAGVRSILNFAPVVLQVPRGVDVRKVDLAVELQILSVPRDARKARVRRPRMTPTRGRCHRSTGTSTGRRCDASDRGRALPPQRPGRRARARRRRRPTTCRRSLDELLRGEHVSEVMLLVDVQPHRGLRRRRRVPRRPRRRSPRCSRGTPACRCPSSPSTSTCTTPGSAVQHLFAVASRARLDGGRRGADPRPAARRPTPRPRAPARSARSCTSSPRPRCASASGCTPTPASTRPARRSSPSRSTTPRRCSAGSRGAGRWSSAPGAMGGLAAAHLRRARGGRGRRAQPHARRARAARRDHRRARHACPRGHARRARRRARRTPTCWWPAPAPSARSCTIDAVAAAVPHRPSARRLRPRPAPRRRPRRRRPSRRHA